MARVFQPNPKKTPTTHLEADAEGCGLANRRDREERHGTVAGIFYVAVSEKPKVMTKKTNEEIALKAADLLNRNDPSAYGTILCALNLATAPLIEKVNKLEAWKEGQMFVESEWDDQKVGRLLGITLGKSIRKEIEPKIVALIERVKELEESVFVAKQIETGHGYLLCSPNVKAAYDDLRAKLEAVEKERDVLMLRSVGAMTIAEGEDNSRLIPIDCPMLVAVRALKDKLEAAETELEQLKKGPQV